MQTDFYTVVVKYKDELFAEFVNTADHDRDFPHDKHITDIEKAVVQAQLKVFEKKGVEAQNVSYYQVENLAIVKGRARTIELEEFDSNRNVKDYTVVLREGGRYGTKMHINASGANIKEAIIDAIKTMGYGFWAKMKDIPLIDLFDYLVREHGIKILLALAGKKAHRIYPY